MATTVDNLVLQFVTRGENNLRRSLQLAAKDMSTVEARAERMNMALNATAKAGAFTVGVMGLIGKAALKSSGEMQKNTVAFEQLLGSADAGNKKIKELQQFAAKTPFSMTQLVQSSKQLLAMGFSADELIPTMRSLGNAMSALGGNDEMFDRVIYNLGQIRSQGKAYAMDLRQFAMAGINVAEIMEKSTGKHLSQAQLTEMDGEEFIANFTKGLDAKFGGMIDKMSETLPGRLNNLGDAFDRLKYKTGDLIAPEAIWAIDKFTAGIEKLEDIAEKHPGLIKAILFGAAGAGVGALVGAGLGKIAFIINQVSEAKGRLTKATELDTAAEAAKTLVAGKEGRAIGAVGSVVERVAGSKGKLATETKALAAEVGWLTEAEIAAQNAGVPVAGAAATTTGRFTGLKNLLARSRSILNKPIAPAMSTVPQLKNGAYVDPMAFYTTRGGKLGMRSQLFPSAPSNMAKMAAARAGLNTSRGLTMLGGESVTVGGAATGALMGAGAGVSAYNNWKMAGDTTGEAAAKAAVTGIITGLGATFVPGGKIAVIVGEGMAWAVNQYINKPMEKAAQGSISDSEIASMSKMTSAQKADFYFRKRDEALARGDSDEAGSFLYQANKYRRRAKSEAQAQRDAAAEAAREERNRQDDWYRRINAMPGSFNQGPQASQSRNGGWTIKLPASPADTSNRNMKFNANTPAPAYL